MNTLARWLLIFTVAVAVMSGGWLARSRLLSASRQRLAQQYIQRLASLPEAEAVGLVHRLAGYDAEWLEVILTASCDERPGVSTAATSELTDLVESWSLLAAPAKSERAAELATLLAKAAPTLPAARRHLAHSLAQRMIVWPVDSSVVDSARFIADCQGLLLLPVTEPAEIRVAAAPEPRAAEPPLVEPPTTETRPTETVIPPEPTPSLPGEPGRIEVPSLRRISDC